MNGRKIAAVITAVTGDRVVVTDEALAHVVDAHFRGIPQDIVLEAMERALKDPTDLFKEVKGAGGEYDYFYRLENGEFLVVVVKIIDEGAFLSSMYPTGKRHRTKHRRFKRVRL